MAIKPHQIIKGTCIDADYLNISYNRAVIAMLLTANYSNFFKG